MDARDDGLPGLTPDEMAGFVRAGEAVPLLGTTASPVLFRDEWWAVSAASFAAGYQPVRDPAQIAVLDSSAVALGWSAPRE